MRLVAYLRIRPGDAPAEVVEARIKRWAAHHGHTVATVRIDAGASAADEVEVRFGMAEAIDDLRERRAESVVVAGLPTLAPTLAGQELWRLEIERAGGTLHALDESGTTTRDRSLVRQALEEAAEFPGMVRALRARKRAAAAGADRERALIAGIEAEQATGPIEPSAPRRRIRRLLRRTPPLDRPSPAGTTDKTIEPPASGRLRS
ncbi:MAG TPA: recombinase family protein [Actinomycetota bacterium]